MCNCDAIVYDNPFLGNGNALTHKYELEDI